MIAHGNDMVEQAHNRVLIAEPLEGIGGRGAPASLYTYILTKLRIFNDVSSLPERSRLHLFVDDPKKDFAEPARAHGFWLPLVLVLSRSDL